MVTAFGDLLRRHRTAAGLSQAELAERANLTAKAIGALERGERQHPQPHTVRRLAEALNLASVARAEFLAAAAHRSTDADSPLPVAAGLPAPLTPLVGRQREMRELVGLLSASRLVTLTGVGGTGKTRLAIELASSVRDTFPDGTVFVNLAPIAEARLVPLVIEHALGAQQASGSTPAERMASLLRQRVVLLVLDNLEQVLEAAPVISSLLTSAPGLRVLATSRVRLHLYGEHEYRVPPLSLPSDGQPLTESDAVRLFVQSARAAGRTLDITPTTAPTLAAICQRLDGLPLAIELAAARTRLFSPDALLARLDRRLAVLAERRRDLPARQQTLRETFDWSYGLLQPEERRVFARLGIFAGSFNAEAVEAVDPASGCTDAVLSGLEGLHDSGLLERVDCPGDDVRFGLLETVREYALARLAESGEFDAVRRRYAAYYLELAERARQAMTGADQRAWMDRLDSEMDNLRAVLDGCLAHREAETALRLVGALGLFWFIRSHWTEGQQWLDQALALDGDAVAPDARAHAWWSLGAIAWRQGNLERAQTASTISLRLWEAAGHAEGMSAAHLILGLTALGHGDMSAARAYEESAVALAAQTGQAWVSAQTQLCLSIVCAVQGDIDRATSLLAGCLDHLRALGDERGTALARLHMGILALRRGDYAEARAPLEDALELFTAVQDLAGTAESRMQRVTLPAMDVLSSDVGRLSLEWSPGKTTFEAGTHQPVEQPQTTSRSWPLSKFTFKLGTLDPRSVLGIKSFTVETLVGKPPAFPNLVLTLDESTGGGWQTWFDSFLAGHTGAANERSGTITLLDSSGIPLALISLKGVGMCRLDPRPGSTADAPPRLEAELYVEQMDIAPGR